MLARTAAQVRPLLGAWRSHRLDSTAGENFYERIMPLALSKLVQMLQSLRTRRGGVISRTPVVLLILEQGGDWCLCVVLWRFERALLCGVLVVSIVVVSSMVKRSARFYTREGPCATVAALFGFKVLFDTWRVMKGEAPAPGRLYFDSCNVVVTRGLFGATESVPKVVVVGAILAQTGPATSASIGLYLLIALACINGINTYDTATIEMLPELARVQPPGVGAVAAADAAARAPRARRFSRRHRREHAEGIRVAWRAASTVERRPGGVSRGAAVLLLAAIVCLEERADSSATVGRRGRRDHGAAHVGRRVGLLLAHAAVRGGVQLPLDHARSAHLRECGASDHARLPGEGVVATVAALLGLKPLVEGFNIIFGNEDDEGSGR